MECLNETSDKEGVKILIDVLVKHGVKRVVLSPGSRNAPLLIAFAREKRIAHFVVLDERSAAFFALGMAQQTGEAVVLVCTSGSAPLNYAPALAEAYYQRLPLIAVTADRPMEWIDQGDCQTIRQQGMFANLVKASYQLPAEVRDEDDSWYANRIVNDAMNCACKGRKGPVHINIPLREPLYGQRTYPRGEVRKVEFVDSAVTLASEPLRRLVARFNTSSKVMVLAGFYFPNDELRQTLHELSAFENVVVLLESPTNMGSERHVENIDRVLSTINESERNEYTPDLLITFGGALISKNIKTFLRKHSPKEHWSVDRGEHLADTFKVLTSQIDLDAEIFFPLLAENLKPIASNYASLWRAKKDLAERKHQQFAEQVEWSDWKAFSMILPALPQGVALQLANSTSVRYAQLFNYPQVMRVDGNRGTSGIEGSTSTAVGAAVVNSHLTVLITGDMSFLYDSNALWNRYITPRLKIIVIKNGGGGIFRFIAGASEQKELEECFETAQEVDVEGFAKLHHFDYFYAANEEELKDSLVAFFAESEQSAILAIETPRLKNAEVLKDYFRKLKQI